MEAPYRKHGMADQFDAMKAQLDVQQKRLEEQNQEMARLSRNDVKRDRESSFRTGMVFCGGVMAGLALSAQHVQSQTADNVDRVYEAPSAQGGAASDVAEERMSLDVSQVDSSGWNFELPVCRKEPPEPIVLDFVTFDAVPLVNDAFWSQHHPFLVPQDPTLRSRFDIIPIELVEGSAEQE